ncbi:unnamed protein product [Choristocarpus tenellus]
MVPTVQHQTLMARQASFLSETKAKRDLLRPRSCNMGGEIKGILASLEGSFDDMTPKVETYQDPAWKEQAKGMTARELPQIRSTGLELGPTPGLGSIIYAGEDGPALAERQGGGQGLSGSALWGGMEDAVSSTSCRAMSRFKRGGKWLGDLDVRRQLLEENPLLKRSILLQKSSGRYAEEIVIPGGTVSVSNPTGKTEELGMKLRRIPASRQGLPLDHFLAKEVERDQLVVICCVRSDDPLCWKVERVAELVNAFLHHRSGTGVQTDERHEGKGEQVPIPPGLPFQLVHVDFCESKKAADFFGVKSLPTFLMFHGGRSIWAGSLGGTPLKAAPPRTGSGVCRVLLVEPDAKVG